MHQKHVEILQVQLEGKRQQKRDYELKLEQKMLRIERMQEEYQQLEEELQPLIETVQSQIEKLENMSTCSKRVHAVASPNAILSSPGMVESIVDCRSLPFMSSSGSESIRADGESPRSAQVAERG